MEPGGSDVRSPAGLEELTACLLGGSQHLWRPGRWREETDTEKPLISGPEADPSLSGDEWGWHVDFSARQ